MALQLKNIVGTKYAPNRELITSSGTPSLDFVIGGGLPVGSLVLVEEDENGNYSKALLKYFLSEGIVTGHNILFASLDNDPRQFINNLPSMANVEVSTSKEAIDNNSDEIKIAWRYKHMSPVDTLMEPKSQFGHHFDMGVKIDSSVIKNSLISLFEASECPSNNEESNYEKLLQFIRKEIDNNGFSDINSNQKNSLLRIGIESVGSPFWESMNNSDKTTGKEAFCLRNFLKRLKVMIASACAVVFVTVPTILFEQLGTVHHLRFLSDMSVKLDSFAGTPRENNPALKDYHGLFYVTKLATMKSVVGVESRIFDLAFKLRRKKFVIEKLHLPPELQESSEREQDDVPTQSCGSSNKSVLDF